MAHSNGPLVVFHHKDAREFVKRCHVERFVELAYVAGTVSEEVDCDLVSVIVVKDAFLVGDLEGGAEADRDTFSDEGISTEL